ncbi:EAL domain-containing protein [Buttiauxella massiliensis]|uniref:EAL domain-containing protein n=1 Tax=Buttiauxella massiliensis TaxID=2831590 RepID=UPI00186A8035|nr:EAL domain-containing protein [Buttiauxella massiliensis]
MQISAETRNTIKRMLEACVLLFLFHYVFGQLMSSAEVGGYALTFYDLRLPLFTALLVLYGVRAIPALGLLIIYSLNTQSVLQNLTVYSQFLAASISCLIYFISVGSKGAVSFGRYKLTFHRIGWLVVFNSVVFEVIHQLMLFLFHFDEVLYGEFFSTKNLINVQWMMTSCLTGVPFCYLILRCISNTAWCSRYLNEQIKIIFSGSRIFYRIIWLCSLIGIMYCLLSTKQTFLLFTGYGLLWLLPIMVWGTVTIGHSFIVPIWSAVLILLGFHSDGYIQYNYAISELEILEPLATASATLLVVSFSLVLSGVLVSSNRSYIKKITRLMQTEFYTGLSNVYALKKSLADYPGSGLALIHCPELWTLTQTHGLSIRFMFVKSLTAYLLPHLQDNEEIYYQPGYGLYIRLSSPDKEHINNIYSLVKTYRFSHGNNTLGINSGLAYMLSLPERYNLLMIVGKLSAVAAESINSEVPVMVVWDDTDFLTVGRNIKSNDNIRSELQSAIDNQSFILMAQPVISSRTDSYYHEVLIRIRNKDGKLLFPDAFLPIAEQAGILAQLDMTVIEQTFRFIQSLEESKSESKFSINLAPRTLHHIYFIDHLMGLFKKYKISPDRIIFEIVETDIIDTKVAALKLEKMRSLGCKIAIDDFGAGCSSYSRLEEIEADILKIDGSFIRKILHDDLNHFLVRSFCTVARIKKMQVVAEFVENEEIKQELIRIGVDWLQGYHTGKPVPIEEVIL